MLKVAGGPVARVGLVAPAGPVGPGVSVESEESVESVESEEEIRVQTSLSPFSLVDRQCSLLKLAVILIWTKNRHVSVRSSP